MAGPIAQPHTNLLGLNLPEVLSNFSKIDQWIPVESSGFNRNAPIRAFIFTIVAGHLPSRWMLVSSSSPQSRHREFSLIPMTFKYRLSQLCPVKSPTKIPRSRLQRPIAYLVRDLLYLCNSNLPCRHPWCCCQSQFDLFPYRRTVNRINRKT